MCELCDNYDPYDYEGLERGDAPGHMWVTHDRRVIDVRTMDRHHAWNLLRWADRNGIELGLERRLLIVERLDYMPKWETVWFHSRNIWFRVTHPTWRKP